jgi:hypothetical protein
MAGRKRRRKEDDAHIGVLGYAIIATGLVVGGIGAGLAVVIAVTSESVAKPDGNLALLFVAGSLTATVSVGLLYTKRWALYALYVNAAVSVPVAAISLESGREQAATALIGALLAVVTCVYFARRAVLFTNAQGPRPPAHEGATRERVHVVALVVVAAGVALLVYSAADYDRIRMEVYKIVVYEERAKLGMAIGAALALVGSFVVWRRRP